MLEKSKNPPTKHKLTTPALVRLVCVRVFRAHMWDPTEHNSLMDHAPEPATRCVWGAAL